MHRAHKISLDPTRAQVRYFRKACGCARVAYNWALDHVRKRLDAGELVENQYELKQLFNKVKKDLFPWMSEVTKCAPEGALMNFEKARRNFFAKRSKFPTHHKKGVNDSFMVANDAFRCESKKAYIPKLGSVRMREPLRFTGKIMRGTVKCETDRWFLVVCVELPDPVPPLRDSQTVGVDLGIKALATLSTGETVEGPKALAKTLARIKRLNRTVSRRKKGSNRRRKAVKLLAKAHCRVKCIRQDHLHKLTTRLAKQYSVVGIEDLNVKGMVKNKKLGRQLSDQSFGEFRRQLEYKAPTFGSKIIVTDRFYPSSKTCNCCGYKNEMLALSHRHWVYDQCGSRHDRDVNAAVNLMKLAVGLTVNARGAG